MKKKLLILLISFFLLICGSASKKQIIGYWKFKDISSPNMNLKENDVEKYNAAIEEGRMNWYIQFNENGTFILNGAKKAEGKYNLTDNDNTLVLAIEGEKQLQCPIEKLSSSELIYKVIEKKKFSEGSEEVSFTWIKE